MATGSLHGRFRLTRTRAEARLADLADEVAAGLGAEQKSLPCRFLYDDEGSRLFDEISRLPEYYLTRAEAAILEQYADEIAALCPGPATLVELGSGSAGKTRLLIEALLRRSDRLHFAPIDISASALEASSRSLLEAYPRLEISGFACEYEEGLARLEEVVTGPLLILWLGSNVGNLTREEAGVFLAGVRRRLGREDRFLMGVDLHKDTPTIEAAYDDAGGVTERFSRNLLRRINRELESSFDPAAFSHEAHYLPGEGRVAIHLTSRRQQTVAVARLGTAFRFEAGEQIHIEDSYKYRPAQIDVLAKRAGFQVVRRWLDSGGLFSENLLRPC